MPRLGLRTGRPEAATLNDMDDLKARAASADQERRERLNKRLRAAFIEDAEADSRRRVGRGLTDEEQERVLWRYPGDAIERWSSGTDDERGDADDHRSR